VIEVNKDLARPEPLLDLFARNDFARMLQQHGQDKEGLVWEAHSSAVPVKLSSSQVGLKNTKTYRCDWNG
jgi:hypothetical protein